MRAPGTVVAAGPRFLQSPATEGPASMNRTASIILLASVLLFAACAVDPPAGAGAPHPASTSPPSATTTGETATDDGQDGDAGGLVYRDSYTREARPPGYREPDVVYVPTPAAVVEAMLELAQVGSDDMLYDLGSGDGRIPIAAAKRFGTRGVGIDINPVRIREANANARAAGVTGLVSFRREDLFEADFSDATVVTLYLLPALNQRLRPRLLAELAPGTRVVSHAFDMGEEWPPDRTLRVDNSVVHLWTVPPRAEDAGPDPRP